MKKKRVLASLMATVMTFSILSSNVAATEVMPNEPVFVEETVAETENTVAEESVVSDSAVEVEEAAVEEDEQDVVAMDGWAKGTTGNSNKYTVKPGENSVDISIDKVNTGKVSKTEDSVAYYMYEVPEDYDFSLSGKLTINGYNNMTGASNPHQSSVGMAVFDELWTGGGGTTNSIWAMSYAPKSTSATAAFYGASRTSAADKDLGDKLSDDFAIVGNNLGTYDIKIEKSGDSYVVSVNGNKWSYSASEDMFKDTVYVGFYGARGANISVTDIELNVITDVVSSLEVATPPNKTVYSVFDELDMTGAKVLAVYSNGAKEEITDYIVTGFDSATVGKKVMTLTKGKGSVDFEYEVVKAPCTKVELTNAPIKNQFSVDMRFDAKGLEAVASCDNGATVDFDNTSAAYYIGDKKIDENYYFTSADVGTQTVKVFKGEDDSFAEGTGYAEYKITVLNNKLESIRVLVNPNKLTYYIGYDLDLAGLSVAGVYRGADNTVTNVLLEDEYTVSGFENSTPGNRELVIKSTKNPSLTATIPYSVLEIKPLRYIVDEYPRTTYAVGEKFDTKDMVVGILYNDNTIEETNNYTVDLKDFDSSKVGTTYVSVVPGDASYEAIKLAVTITENKEHYWKSTYFGQSTNKSSNKCTVIDENTVNVSASFGAGKITADHDGIAYYYTRVSDKNNFVLEGDVTVNKYLQDGVDQNRNGQESFGFMFRDIIPLQSAADANALVIHEDDAALDENGEPIPIHSSGAIFQSNIALLGGYSGTGWPTDPTAASYNKNCNINRINLMWRTGADKTENAPTVKNGPVSVSTAFPVPGDKYHLTLRKIQNGIYAKCYNYQTGETMETYQYPDIDNGGESYLAIQNPDTSYVGFYAARYADITVSDFTVYESNPETDQYVYDLSEADVIPTINVTSGYYTKNADYVLYLKANNDLGGLVTVKLNDEVIYSDVRMPFNGKALSLDTKLVPNSINNFTVYYEPNPADAITSSEPILFRFTVTHNGSENTLNDLYVSPDGKVDAKGTIDDPMDLATAIGTVARGQKIIALGGVYKPSGVIEISSINTGSFKAGKYLYAEEGKDVILDMQGLYAGMTLDADYWHIKGIDITNTAENQKGFHLGGSNNIIEDCKFYNNGDTGFQVSRISGENETMESWPTNNLILNCEAYNNADPAGINADGFGAKLTVGYNNVFRGCVSHHNLDDGWDCYTKAGTGAIGPVTLEGCISYKQGIELLEDGKESSYASGGHNGYKIGGENVFVQHYMKDCYAFENSGNGITSNSNPAFKMRNVISYNNNGNNFSLYSNSSTAKSTYDFNLKGCISVASTDSIGTYNKDSGGYLHKLAVSTVKADNSVVTQSYNFADSLWSSQADYNGTTENDSLSLSGYYYVGSHGIEVSKPDTGKVKTNLDTNMSVKVPAGTTTIDMNGCFYGASGNVNIDAVTVDETGAQVVNSVANNVRFTPSTTSGNEDTITTFTYTGDKDATIVFTFTGNGYNNASPVPVFNETNFFRTFGTGSANADLTLIKGIITDGVIDYYYVPNGKEYNSVDELEKVFKSIDSSSVLVNGRLSQDENGKYIMGDFLARTKEYVHDSADLVNYDQGMVDTKPSEPTTEVTTNGNIENTETTTKKATTSNGGGGGGGGSSSIKATTTVSSEATTEASTEASTEATTSANVVAVGNVEVSIGEYAVVINGTAYDVDAAAYIQAESQSTLVPLRFVALAIAGGNVADADNSDAIVWNAVDKSATIFAGNRVIVFQAGSDIMVVDNTPQLMDNGVKAEITDGRMYVPFRALGKALGVDVDWDANTKTAKFIATVVEETTEATTEEVTDEATTEEVTADAEEETTTVDASEETTVAETEVEETTEEVTEA